MGNAQTSPALAGQVGRQVRPVAAALRAYKQGDMDGVMVLVSRQACDEAADTLESLARLVSELEMWQAEGELLISSDRASVMFALGHWWADRPWRKRPNAEFTGCRRQSGATPG